MSDPRDDIAEIEAKIESLSEAAERCRKIIIVSKAVCAGGGLLLVATMLGLIQAGPSALVLAITAILAGIALSGTTRSTLDEILGQIREHERHRSAMIDRVQLQIVETA